MNKKRIGVLTVSDMSVELLLKPQIKFLQDAGFEVEIICADGPWISELRKEGFQITTIPILREPSPLKDLKVLFQLVRLLKRKKFDVTISHTPKAGLLGPLAAKVAGVPVVIHTVHGFLFHDQMKFLSRSFFWCVEKFTATFSDYLFFQSLEDTQTAVNAKICRPEKIRYIGNGINLHHFAKNPESTKRNEIRRQLGFAQKDFIVGIIGRLVTEKGFNELFIAARRLIQQNFPIQVLIVGPSEEGLQRDALKDKDLIELEKTGRFHFLGMRRDTADLLSAMDLFVLPSYREGIPRALMEACAMEVPSIATDIRGCREVIEDGTTGLLVPVKNAKAIEERILLLIDEPEFRESMGIQAGQKMRTEFNEDFVHQRMGEALRQCVAS